MSCTFMKLEVDGVRGLSPDKACATRNRAAVTGHAVRECASVGDVVQSVPSFGVANFRPSPVHF